MEKERFEDGLFLGSEMINNALMKKSNYHMILPLIDK